jgi:hypothetical protein
MVLVLGAVVNTNLTCSSLELLFRCPWTGTGIGKGNLPCFKVFVVGVNILCYFSIILLVWSLLDGLVS